MENSALKMVNFALKMMNTNAHRRCFGEFGIVEAVRVFAARGLVLYAHKSR